MWSNFQQWHFFFSLSESRQHPDKPRKPCENAGGDPGLLHRQWRQRSKKVMKRILSESSDVHTVEQLILQIKKIEKHSDQTSAAKTQTLENRIIRPHSDVDLLLLLNRALFYCKACHDDITDPKRIKKCGCKKCRWPYFQTVSELITFLFRD